MNDFVGLKCLLLNDGKSEVDAIHMTSQWLEADLFARDTFFSKS